MEKEKRKNGAGERRHLWLFTILLGISLFLTVSVIATPPPSPYPLSRTSYGELLRIYAQPTNPNMPVHILIMLGTFLIAGVIFLFKFRSRKNLFIVTPFLIYAICLMVFYGGMSNLEQYQIQHVETVEIDDYTYHLALHTWQSLNYYKNDVWVVHRCEEEREQCIQIQVEGWTASRGFYYDYSIETLHMEYQAAGNEFVITGMEGEISRISLDDFAGLD